MKQYDETREETPAMVPVQRLKGQYVRRKPDAKRTYIVKRYCQFNKAWQLDDCDDISRCIFVKPGTMLYAGFDY